MRFSSKGARRVRSLAAIGLVGALGACDSLLEVTNPGTLGDDAINDADLVTSMAASVPGRFGIFFDDLVLAGSILTDEAVNGHNFEQWKDFDLRIVESSNTILASDVYEPIQEARGVADDFTARMRQLLGAKASSDLGLARALAYGGYSYLILGEYFCEAPVQAEGQALNSNQIVAEAIKRFDEAIAVATAAKGAGTPAARADTVINLARVGAARASLFLNNKQAAAQYASPVPAAFTVWVPFSTNTALPNNRLQAANSGTNRYLGVGPEFQFLNDRRVRHAANWVTGHNGLTRLYTPFQAPSHSEWSPTTTTAFNQGTDIRLASGLEAQYIVAEAQGPTAATLAFVNARRAVGGQAPVVLAGDALMAELREQRSRDFYLDGHRLGDLRRYKQHYGVDEFPSGQHPNADWGNYGTATCFVPHDDEKVGNPNY